jgi:ADP-heptose:LPS heptosyltransferase
LIPWLRKPRVPKEPGNGRLLRLRAPSGFGDHLMVSAVIEGLRAEHPELRIQVLGRHPELFLHNPHVEEALDIKRVRKENPDLIEEFIHATHRPPEARYLQVSGHLIDDIYDVTGIPVAKRPRQPRIYLTAEELAFEQRRLEALPHPRIAIAPWGKGSVVLPNKLYPDDQWLELGHLLTSTFPSVLHLGTKKEGPLIKGALDFRDLGFRATASLLRRCDLLVTHVGGVMHLAAAVRTPAVVLYGAAEHPAISGYPWNRNLYVPIECGPCWSREPCAHHSCMRQLTPQRVIGEIACALAAERSSPRRHGDTEFRTV